MDASEHDRRLPGKPNPQHGGSLDHGMSFVGFGFGLLLKTPWIPQDTGPCTAFATSMCQECRVPWSLFKAKLGTTMAAASFLMLAPDSLTDAMDIKSCAGLDTLK